MNRLNRLLARPGLGLIALAYIAFIALGLPDGLFGVALPSIRADFGIAVDAVGPFFLEMAKANVDVAYRKGA